MKLLHAADFHLDAPFAALSPEKAALRRAEGRQLLTRLAELAREEKADLVLLAGDLFDGQTVYPETLAALREALASIPAPVLIAPGNHDPFTPRSPYAALTWPENVTIFTSETVSSLPFPELGCTVHGLGFCHPQAVSPLLEGFSVPADGGIHVGLFHGDVTLSSSDYNPISPEQIARSGLDYLALGHIHTPSGRQQSGNTVWAYPGCPEGHGFDELGDRGCLIAEVEKGRVELTFRPLALRRYLEVEADVSETDPLTAAQRALAGISSLDCVKLIFTGECDTPPNLTALEARLSPCVFALRLRDRTRPHRGLWDKVEEDTLTGAFLRLMKETLDAGDPAAELAVRFGLSALEQGEDCRA